MYNYWRIVSRSDGDDQVKDNEGQPQKMTGYRSHLVARCIDTCRDWTRVTCDNVSRSAPGTYRILGIVRSVNNKDYIMMGYCKECGKLDKVENFENRDKQLFCCNKVKYRRNKIKVLQNQAKDTCLFLFVSRSLWIEKVMANFSLSQAAFQSLQ